MSHIEAKLNFIEVIQLNINSMRNSLEAFRVFKTKPSEDELLRLENLLQTALTLVADYRHDPLKFLKFSEYYEQATRGSSSVA